MNKKIKWIIKNKTWLFSGIGVSVIGLFLSVVFEISGIKPGPSINHSGDTQKIISNPSSINIQVQGEARDINVLTHNEQENHRASEVAIDSAKVFNNSKGLLVMDISVRNPTGKVVLLSAFELVFTNKRLMEVVSRPSAYVESSASYNVFVNRDSTLIKVNDDSLTLDTTLSYPSGSGYEAHIRIPLWQKIVSNDIDRFKIAFKFDQPPAFNYDILIGKIHYAIGKPIKDIYGEVLPSVVYTEPLNRF